MAPWVRRTWSPRGRTPVLYQRTRHHTKVSVIAALCVAPHRDRVHLYFRLHGDAQINTDLVIDFLRQLNRQLQGRIILLWDRLGAHRSKSTQGFLSDTPALHPVFLPPYAPDLNPVEFVWSYLKTKPLANLALTELPSLQSVTRRHARSLQHKERLLRSFLKHSPLILRLR